MAKLSKQQAKQHHEACKILTKDRLDLDERVFVLEHWREDAQHINSSAGAFFTPGGLARDLAHEITGKYVVDLCAGIGSLAYSAWIADGNRQITCVEINRDYFEVGKKVLPEASWELWDVFDFNPQVHIGRAEAAKRRCIGKPYDCAIANPPFGNVKTHKNQYGSFEYDLIAHASTLATDGVFLIPQMSTPFRYSGCGHFEKVINQRYEKFNSRTGITLTMNCGFDTSGYQDEWTIKPPVLEIVLGFQEEILHYDTRQTTRLTSGSHPLQLG